MNERILNIMDIRELLIHIRAESSNRQVYRDTGVDRRTVQRYREWAQEEKLLEGELPGLEELLVRLDGRFQEKMHPRPKFSFPGPKKSFRGGANKLIS
jgi:hypothetical protein